MEELEKLLTQIDTHLKEVIRLLSTVREKLCDFKTQTPSPAKPSTVSVGKTSDETLIVVEGKASQSENVEEELEEQVDRSQLLLPIVELAKETPGLFGQKEAKELFRAVQREWAEGDEDALEYAKVVWLCAATRCRFALASSQPLLRLEELLSSAESALVGGYTILWKKGQVEKEYFQPVPVYASEPEATAVAVVEPAVKKDGHPLRVGRVALSVGKNHKVSEVVIAAIRALSSISPPNPEASNDIYSFLRQFHSWWLGMPKACLLYTSPSPRD